MIFYYLILIFAAFLFGGLSFYSATFRNIRGARIFAVTMVAVTIWITFYLLELLSIQEEIRLIWLKFKYVGIISIPPSFLIFILIFSSRLKKVHTNTVLLLSIIPSISIALAFTNECHKLFFHEITYLNEIIINPGPWYWIHIVYSYLLMIFSIFILFKYTNKRIEHNKKQVIMIFIGSIIPLLTNFANQMILLLPEFRDIIVNPTMPSFIISGFVIFYGMFRYNFFNINPVARDIIFEKIDDGVLVLDKNGKIVDCNIAATKILDRDMESLIDSYAEDHFHIWPDLIDRLNKKENLKDEVKLLINNEIEYFDINFYPIYSNDREYLGKVMVGRNITERKMVEIKYKYLSIHDKLTGLYNRTYFDEEVHRLENSRNFPVTIFVIDLDDLKLVNDNYGHPAGDKLLQNMANFLRYIFRYEDMVARVGGDEFIILLPNTDEKIAEIIKNRMIASLENFNSKINDNRISFSLGIKTQYDKGDLSKTIKEADELMYLDKQSKKKKIFK